MLLSHELEVARWWEFPRYTFIHSGINASDLLWIQICISISLEQVLGSAGCLSDCHGVGVMLPYEEILHGDLPLPSTARFRMT